MMKEGLQVMRGGSLGDEGGGMGEEGPQVMREEGP